MKRPVEIAAAAAALSLIAWSAVTACLKLGVSHRASMKRRRFSKIRRTSTRREGVNCVTDFGNGMPKRSIYPGYSTFKWLFKEKQIAERRFVALGQQVDLTQLRAPIFLLAASNDEVVSVDQLFATTRLTAASWIDWIRNIRNGRSWVMG